MKTAIIGLGKSGIAAGRILRGQGVTDITIFDDREGTSLAEFADGFDVTVISPGIDPKKIPNYPKSFTSEIKLGLDAISPNTRVIAITGTDGKSTVTTLTAQILRGAGYNAIECGNFGYPLADAVLDHGADTIFVLELSSYQLDLLPEKPFFDVACILNIAPDHLDRYGTIENYTASKHRIKNMLKPNGKFFDSAPHIEYSNYPLPGAHNKTNLDFAIELCSSVAILPDNLSPIIANLAGLEHRMEPVPTTDGLYWYNDSKGTTIQAVSNALKSFDSRVILLLGGRDKNLDFTPLVDDINARCDTIVLFGEAADKISGQIKDHVTQPIIITTSLKDAVEKARMAAMSGSHILLSPGCTSWDEFKSFEERGKAFKEYVKNEQV
ncbi:MAG: UDP-N-acetylmuramoyl-L-alanine--D-glutamate ligase [Alphaproteobacteria bacterium]|nr:UDP-N-acetylmuramoyl-L-alanine--D-glutamate ligase [Alphaproteobacteria bacterium]